MAEVDHLEEVQVEEAVQDLQVHQVEEADLEDHSLRPLRKEDQT